MAVITITEADLAKASTYIPIESKDRIARIVAAFCVEPADGENVRPYIGRTASSGRCSSWAFWRKCICTGITGSSG